MSGVEPVEWKALPARPCPVAGSLDLLGDRWSMLVVRDVMNGVRRFDDLVGRLGVSRATLADRLRRLVEAGILVPVPYQTEGGRTREEYRLTAKGWELRNVLIALREWGDRYVLGDDDARLRLVDRESGHEVRLRLVDAETGDEVEPRRLVHAIRSAPRPGRRR
ncbi:MAG TPA: winged helix-turn-helix transcriptional regulator [Acidimicrobiales bacterium]